MLIHAREAVPGDIVIASKHNTQSAKVKYVDVSEDGSTVLTYYDGTTEWFGVTGIIIRKQHVESPD